MINLQCTATHCSNFLLLFFYYLYNAVLIPAAMLEYVPSAVIVKNVTNCNDFHCFVSLLVSFCCCCCISITVILSRINCMHRCENSSSPYQTYYLFLELLGVVTEIVCVFWLHFLLIKLTFLLQLCCVVVKKWWKCIDKGGIKCGFGAEMKVRSENIRRKTKKNYLILKWRIFVVKRNLQADLFPK